MTLEEQFLKETGTPTINSQGEPDIDFIDWLKKKLTSKREDQRFEAAKTAMQGLLANPIYNNPNEKHNMVTVPHLTLAAKHYADALMQALEGEA